MAALESLNLGIAGAGRRGGSFKAACEALGMRIHAVCDVDPERLDAAATRLAADEKYLDYDEMLTDASLDAVIIGTPMHLHASQAITALESGVHVLSEVTAAVSIDECRRLVQACRQSHALYRMAENCNYMQSNVMVAAMVARGLFGQTYYAEGEYLHELKLLNEATPWRRRWQSGVKGITYGTHSLGPILQWMPGDRVIAVCCAGTGHHYQDARGQPYENDDTSVMLCKLASGGLIKVRVDMLSYRPYGLYYTLQGTEGAYESARSREEVDRVWLRSRTSDQEHWLRLADFEDEFLPEWWRHHATAARASGHDGSDYFVLLDFIDAITGRTSLDTCTRNIGIHEALDMTLPGLVSQQWAAQNGVWLDVPDSRAW